MNMNEPQQTAPGQIDRTPSRLSRFFMHIFMPAVALVGGVAITIYLLNSGPQARPAKRAPNATLVEVQKLYSEPQQTLVSGMGEIIAAREVEIKPQVSGEIISTSKNFQPGGYFSADEELLSIDQSDYKLILRQLESDVKKAESDLDLEMGNQRISEREYTLLGEEVSDEEKNLILRKPQLEKLQATLNNAQTKVDQARINLERTRVKSPFNGVVVEKMVDTGAKINESTTLAKIVGTDFFWLRLSLPIDQLQWLTIPDNNKENGALVNIFPQGTSSAVNSRQGKVVRLMAALEEQGRMAQILIRIDDPLCLKKENRDKPKLLLGSYVHAKIEGITLETGYRIDRSNLHDNNTVWLMDETGRLDIRQVDVSYKERDKVIVSSGIRDGESLVVSSLSSPIAGTPLRLNDDNAAVNDQMSKKGMAAKQEKSGKNHAE